MQLFPNTVCLGYQLHRVEGGDLDRVRGDPDGISPPPRCSVMTGLESHIKACRMDGDRSHGSRARGRLAVTDTHTHTRPSGWGRKEHALGA
jgi:hypothetical protein